MIHGVLQKIHSRMDNKMLTAVHYEVPNFLPYSCLESPDGSWSGE